MKTKNIKHNGNISLDDVIEIAKVMSPRSMAKDLSGTVKEILGACVSVGCTVDGKDPKDLQQKIADKGRRDSSGLKVVVFFV
ncbi:60S ribosomal protein L12 [Quillaja saponaria]|uniref:60S ribosomal protein L12 n=1 Tax=Quillaja saponaria TaxID=32244 RepID=A0AAD7VGY0_QUISA|nr:60S ribosomal protein L12 [Quillaja saponaria]